MLFLDTLARKFPAPRLTPGRIGIALGVAALVDALQVALGPLGWGPLDEILDVIGCVIICWQLGFHPLLLPTFVLECVPVVDMLPTWTGCVALVIAMRRKAERETMTSPSIPVETVSRPQAPPVLPPPPPA